LPFPGKVIHHLSFKWVRDGEIVVGFIFIAQMWLHATSFIARFFAWNNRSKGQMSEKAKVRRNRKELPVGSGVLLG
jgi:hypothetical protein